MFKEEWKQFTKNRMMRLMLLGVAIIPTIYGVIFLKSMWDPYGSLKDLPVAIVNNDHPIQKNGTKMAVGEEFVQELKKSKNMNFKFISTKKAKDELAKGEVFMTVEIPSDFSKSAASIDSKNPQKMKLDYTTTAGYNFVAMKMSESAVTKMKDEINEKISSAYMKSIVDSMKNVGMNLTEASAGSKKITHNLTLAQQGTNDLSTGLNTLVAGSTTLNEGIASYTNGASTAAEKIKDLNQGTTKLKDGSSQLSDGMDEAVTGSQKVSGGLQQLNQQSDKMTSGSEQVKQGAEGIQAGAATLAEKTKELSEGVSAISAGSSQVSNGFSALHKGVQDSVAAEGKLSQALLLALKSAKASNDVATATILQQIISEASSSTSTKDLETAVSTLENGSKALTENLTKASVGAKQLAAGTSELSEKSKELSLGASQVNDGVKAYTSGVQQLETGASALSTGISGLQNGANQLENGLTSLSDGSSRLAGATVGLMTNSKSLQEGAESLTNGVKTAANGSSTLGNGLGKLTEGSQTLTSKLKDGSREISNKSDRLKDSISQLVTPIVTEHTEKTKVENNGTGMAPYMISIALWVGSLAMTIAFDIFKKIKTPHSGLEWWASKFSILYLLGIGQSLILYFGLTSLLGMKVENPIETLLLMFVASLAFVGINGYLTTAFGKVGNFLGLILLVLQLGSAGGTYPLALTPKIFQILNPFLPISHSVFGFRQTISIHADASAQIFILLGFALVFGLLNIARLHRLVTKEKTILAA
ncbi:MAG: YhgE/Pip domain-containing protein [Streptococcaceae bacterium]|jgi:putative membrane protein|nr:YhgE/Pip domain-containing protein [Streptococcaceae bacterium]